MEKQRGFTLIELIVATVLSTLVLLGLIAIFSGTLTVWTRIHESGDTLKEARIAMQWLTRDIREEKIVTANPHSIGFTDVEYILQGTTLERNGNLVAQGVTGVSFNYNNPMDVKFVSIVIKIKQGSKELEFRNGAGVRNYETT